METGSKKKRRKCIGAKIDPEIRPQGRLSTYFWPSMKLAEIAALLHQLAPQNLQESYDNAGIITGNPDMQIRGVTVTLDCTVAVIEDALSNGCNMVVAHHPLIFKPLRSLTGKDYVERALMLAIKKDVAVMALHTNLDNVAHGVNAAMAKKLALRNTAVLRPRPESLGKIVTYVPTKYVDAVRQAMFAAGAGKIGDYDACSFNTEGFGTYKPLEGATPFAGKIGQWHTEPETKVEMVFSIVLQNQIVAALKEAHPYQEVAYDVFQLKNAHPEIGAGMVGDLELATPLKDFLNTVQSAFKTHSIRYTIPRDANIQRVALCGGSGSFLLQDAIRSGAQAFVSADFKYHEFFDAEDRIAILDIGHFESEQYTTDLIANYLKEKLPTFAVRFSGVNTNPIKYHH
jgi:dinuclear metal center YbgI/SA1388 family protein